MTASLEGVTNYIQKEGIMEKDMSFSNFFFLREHTKKQQEKLPKLNKSRRNLKIRAMDAKVCGGGRGAEKKPSESIVAARYSSWVNVCAFNFVIIGNGAHFLFSFII